MSRKRLRYDKKVLDTLYVFSNDDLYKAYNEMVLPEGVAVNGTNQIEEGSFDLFGDVESFVKCLVDGAKKLCLIKLSS